MRKGARDVDLAHAHTHARPLHLDHRLAWCVNGKTGEEYMLIFPNMGTEQEGKNTFQAKCTENEAYISTARKVP
jgi:thiol:disulfide interchange protein